MRASLTHPTRLLPLAFLGAVCVGTLLLLLPISREGGSSAPPIVAAFTATSAVCIVGLIVVDTPTYWSTFGQAIILGLIQIGGFGIMTSATMLAAIVSRRLRLRAAIAAAAETRAVGIGGLRAVMQRVIVFILISESILSVVLTLRFWVHYEYPLDRSVFHGVFYAISAFNNAGFALHSNSLTPFGADWWITGTVMLGTIVGGIGFPVVLELLRKLPKPSKWSVHTLITVYGTITLLLLGFVSITVVEWSNPATLGDRSVSEKLLAGAFQAVMPRSGGFNTIDIGSLSDEGWLITTILMFIGGGSAGTAGGIKVTTFFLLAFVIWAQIRGQADVTVYRRRITPATERQALTIALLGVAGVVLGSLALMGLTSEPSTRAVIFEATSAASTVGQSMGVTADLPQLGQALLIVLMFVGRVGSITVASALALATKTPLYRLPKERPIVG